MAYLQQIWIYLQATTINSPCATKPRNIALKSQIITAITRQSLIWPALASIAATDHSILPLALPLTIDDY